MTFSREIGRADRMLPPRHWLERLGSHRQDACERNEPLRTVAVLRVLSLTGLIGMAAFANDVSVGEFRCR